MQTSLMLSAIYAIVILNEAFRRKTDCGVKDPYAAEHKLSVVYAIVILNEALRHGRIAE